MISGFYKTSRINYQSYRDTVQRFERSGFGKLLGPFYLAASVVFHLGVQFVSLFSFLLTGLSGCAGRRETPSPSWDHNRNQDQSQNQNRRIAVLPFESSNPYVPGAILSDYFVVQILRESFGLQVIERNDLMKILQEQKLTLTGVIRPEKFLKIGSILGVDAILSGSIQTLETIQSTSGSISITVKLMEVSTGRILWADRQNVSHATWSVREVQEVAAALMEKAAQKMVQRMEKSDAWRSFSSGEAPESFVMMNEATLRN